MKIKFIFQENSATGCILHGSIYKKLPLERPLRVVNNSKE